MMSSRGTELPHWDRRDCSFLARATTNDREDWMSLSCALLPAVTVCCNCWISFMSFGGCSLRVVFAASPACKRGTSV